MENRELGIRLRMVNNAIRRYLDKSTLKKELDNITCSNTWIIGHIAASGGSVYQRDLESEFGITRSTASKVLILLEKKGLIKREGVMHDARLKRISLTPRSEEIAQRLRENGAEMEKKLTNGFTKEELDTLFSYLDRIRENLESTETHQQ